MKLNSASFNRRTASRSILLASAMLLAGCASDFVQRAQRSEGMLDALLPTGGGTPASLPVETHGSPRGRIFTSFVDETPQGLVVHGLVRSTGFGTPGMGAHLEYQLCDAGGRVLESGRAAFCPGMMPPSMPGRMTPQSRYSFPLHTARPPAGAQLRLVFCDRSHA